MAAWLFGAFGFIAIVLASVGIYSSVSYAVVRRTREIGIRLAIGAAPAAIVRRILFQALRVAAAGLVAGTAIGLLLTRFIASRASSGVYRSVDAVKYFFSCGQPLLAAVFGCSGRNPRPACGEAGPADRTTLRVNRQPPAPRFTARTIPLAHASGTIVKLSSLASSRTSTGIFAAWPSGQFAWGSISSIT